MSHIIWLKVWQLTLILCFSYNCMCVPDIWMSSGITLGFIFNSKNAVLAVGVLSPLGPLLNKQKLKTQSLNPWRKSLRLKNLMSAHLSNSVLEYLNKPSGWGNVSYSVTVTDYFNDWLYPVSRAALEMLIHLRKFQKAWKNRKVYANINKFTGNNCKNGERKKARLEPPNLQKSQLLLSSWQRFMQRLNFPL